MYSPLSAINDGSFALSGTLALKADTAGVEMFFLCGNESLPALALPAEEEGLCLLRIVQRMRLEKHQLDGVDNKMQVRLSAIRPVSFPHILALPVVSCLSSSCLLSPTCLVSLPLSLHHSPSHLVRL